MSLSIFTDDVLEKKFSYDVYLRRCDIISSCIYILGTFGREWGDRSLLGTVGKVMSL